VRIARASRGGIDSVDRYVRWGAGPRASQNLALGARVRAALHGHEVPSIEDVRAVAPAVLCHRLVLNFQAEAEGVSAADVVDTILAEVDTP